MNLKRFAACVVAVLCFSGVGWSQTNTDQYERILLPVFVTEPVAGAYGSVWTSHLWIRNVGNQPVYITPVASCWAACIATPPPYLVVEPNKTVQPRPFRRPGVPGWFLYVEKSEGLQFALRAQDISRQSQTWGTEVPVVREADLFSTTINLFPIPITTDFRSHVRVYDFHPETPNSVIVRVYEFKPDTPWPVVSGRLLAERNYTFYVSPRHSGGRDEHPGYVELADLAEFAAETELVRVEITPVESDLRFWSFAAITNNETQHLTLVTPN